MSFSLIGQIIPLPHNISHQSTLWFGLIWYGSFIPCPKTLLFQNSPIPGPFWVHRWCMKIVRDPMRFVMMFLLVISVGYVQPRHVRNANKGYSRTLFLHTQHNSVVVGHKKHNSQNGDLLLKWACQETSSATTFSTFNIISSINTLLINLWWKDLV
jgi:hypothetical protein